MNPRALSLVVGMTALGCSGAPFTLEPPAPPLESGSLGTLGDAGDAAPWGTMADAGARAETSEDSASEHPSSSSDASAGDVLVEDRETPEAETGISVDAGADAPAPALCCRGPVSVPASSATCYPPNAPLSETCAATPDGGQACTTTTTIAPSSCSAGGACIETLGGQTLPGTIGPC